VGAIGPARQYGICWGRTKQLPEFFLFSGNFGATPAIS
jgi:hypothetical protein